VKHSSEIERLVKTATDYLARRLERTN